MNDLIANSEVQTHGTFAAYLRSQKKLLGVSTGIAVALYFTLRYCFPYPDFFVDSNNYVLWASYKFPVAYRPMGYSSLLQFAHYLSVSASCTVAIQFCLFILSTLFCFFSIDYLFGLPAKIKPPLLIILLCNPILLFQTNLISSDSLFCSLTIFWITTCFWIIKRPQWWSLIVQLLFLFCAFRVRYTAAFFPLIAIVAFILCKGKIAYKITGIALTISLISLSVWQQKTTTQTVTNTNVFSGFAGWQIANNALYCYPYIDIKSSDLPTWETQIIDHCVKMNIDSMERSSTVGYAYIWDNRSPLKRYLRTCEYRNHTDYLVSWFNASVPLNDYGWYIIRHYPAAFALHFILPNAVNYFYPQTEALTNYDYKNIAMTRETKDWFGFTFDHLDCTYPLLQSNVIALYPMMALLLNVFNVVAILFFLLRTVPVWESIPSSTRALFITWCLFFFGYMAFSIFASAINLRFLDYLFVLGYFMPFVLLRLSGKQQTLALAPH